MWAGISKRGRTGICIFEGIMKKELHVSILEGTLLPFISDVYPEEHSCRTTIPSIPLAMLLTGWKIIQSIGEGPLLNRQISIQLRIFGMS